MRWLGKRRIARKIGLFAVLLMLPACMLHREAVRMTPTSEKPPASSEFMPMPSPPNEPMPPLPPTVVRSGRPSDAVDPVPPVQPPPLMIPSMPLTPESTVIPVKLATVEKTPDVVSVPATLTILSEQQRMTHLPEPPLLQVLRSYLDHQPERAISQMQSLPIENRDLVQALIPPLVRLSEGSLDSAGAQELAVLVEQLQAAADRLRSRATLGMGSICFCRRIHKYGVYEPLDTPYRFFAGEMAELYVELRNVASVIDPGNGQKTQLSSTLELRDSSNHVVWRSECDREDRTMSVRRDYYLNYRFQMPHIPVGVYTLGVQITDRPTQRTIRQSLDVRIRARGE